MNKIILTIGSALTVALTSFGIWFARQIIEIEPICYWDLETGYNSINYADTYMILLLGVGVGVGIMVVLRELID
jgi:hypothetical protein|tara:strand:+ start:539 stop:760 length:222 start_codon:yes stop_codon:yes gene_type:complete